MKNKTIRNLYKIALTTNKEEVLDRLLFDLTCMRGMSTLFNEQDYMDYQKTSNMLIPCLMIGLNKRRSGE